MLPDLAQIAFVTRRFRELQGLRSAWVGVAMLAGFCGWTLMPDGWADPYMHLVLPAVLFNVTAINALDRYYDRAFGRVPMTSSRPAAAGLRLPRSFPGDLGFIVVIGMCADTFVEGAAMISLAAGALVACSLWVLVRDWPHRFHYLIGLAAGLAGIVISAAAPRVQRTFYDPMDPNVASHLALTYCLLGVGILAVGLLDHRLLARAMTPPVAAAPAAPVGLEVSRVRVALAGGMLIGLTIQLAVTGWPHVALSVYLSAYAASAALLIVGYPGVRSIGEMRLAYSELTRAREARFLATMAAPEGATLRGPGDDGVHQRIVPVPRFDHIGHLLLPMAAACGMLLDVTLRGSGFPSLLALALAASHLRITLRDWPARSYYLLGSLAASISAVHFMFVPQHQALDWTIWFLILACAAMLVEGLLDYRLSRTPGTDFSKEHHADAI